MTEREQARVWIEGLPGSDEAAGALLDELAPADPDVSRRR